MNRYHRAHQHVQRREPAAWGQVRPADRYEESEVIDWDYEIRREREKERAAVRHLRFNYVNDYSHSKSYNVRDFATHLPRQTQPSFRSRPLHRRGQVKVKP